MKPITYLTGDATKPHGCCCNSYLVHADCLYDEIESQVNNRKGGN